MHVRHKVRPMIRFRASLGALEPVFSIDSTYTWYIPQSLHHHIPQQSSPDAMAEYDRYRISVPGTTANVGPAFDVAGIALSLALTLEVSIPKTRPTERSLPVIEYTGLDSENVPLSPYKNLLTRVALYVLRCHKITSFPSGVRIHANNQIPFGRGLGSSGAAVIAGVLLGDLLGDLKLSKSRLLDFALMVERHPDNVTAALIGGFVGSYLKELSPEDTNASQIPLAEVLPEYPPDAGESWGQDPPLPPHGIGHYVRFGWAKEIKAVAVMPQFELATAKARGVLPDSYTRKDVVFNLQRLAVLTTALATSPPDPDLIYEAMKDRIHQPYRMALVSFFWCHSVSPNTTGAHRCTHAHRFPVCLKSWPH